MRSRSSQAITEQTDSPRAHRQADRDPIIVVGSPQAGERNCPRADLGHAIRSLTAVLSRSAQPEGDLARRHSRCAGHQPRRGCLPGHSLVPITPSSLPSTPRQPRQDRGMARPEIRQQSTARGARPPASGPATVRTSQRGRGRQRSARSLSGSIRLRRVARPPGQSARSTSGRPV